MDPHLDSKGGMVGKFYKYQTASYNANISKILYFDIESIQIKRQRMAGN